MSGIRVSVIHSLLVLQVVSKSANIYPKDPEFPTDGVEDMTRLSYMHEPGVLQNLQIRYTINEIYVRLHNCFCVFLRKFLLS